MDSVTGLDLDELGRQQANLRRRGRLHWMHWAIVGGSALVMIAAWQLSNSLLESRGRLHFEREVERVVDLVRERLAHYEDALLSGVATIRSSNGGLTRTQWRRYTDNLGLAERYPGISGIGVILHLHEGEIDGFLERVGRERADFRIYPEHDFDFRLPIVYIEPELDNAAAIGLDVAFEHNRRTAALEARRTGTRQISGPIVLVQDAGKTPGFLFYAPYYSVPGGYGADREITSRDRESAFLGLVYAPLVVRSLVAGTLDTSNRDVQFSIRDGNELLYDDREDEGSADSSAYRSTRAIELYGRTWTFDFVSATALAGGSGANLSTVVFLGGLALEAMLLGLFVSMSHSSRRALTLAEELTGDLARHAAALSASNEELSNYAHIVSHDLKSPIRGIQDLTSFIREDLAGYLASNDADPEVARNLDRLDRQTEKGQALIRGILDYSSVGVLEEELSIVDVRELIAGIGASLGVRPAQLLTQGDMPTFHTHAIRLGQVFENLIGNAFNYHHDRERASVRVSAEREGALYRFTVADDGPGIDARYHERIFEAFAKLQSSEDANSSGIGLSIVKKSVELLGGSVGIESAVGRGTTIRFDWPAESLRHAA